MSIFTLAILLFEHFQFDLIHVPNIPGSYAISFFTTWDKEWNHAICSNINGTRDCHTKWNVRQRQMISLVKYTKKMIQMKLCTKLKYTHRDRKQFYGYQRGRVGRDKLGVSD